MDFQTAFDRLIGHEGGYVNDPSDPGGETKWGISKRSYPLRNIAELTREDAAQISRCDFWDVVGDIDPALKFQVFDFAVNSGIQTAIRKLQLAVKVADDGHWGPRSAAAVKSMGVNDALMRFAAYRLLFMTDLKNWPSAGRGWARRIAGNLLYAAEDN